MEAIAQAAQIDWRFLDRYPQHYRAARIPAHTPPPVLDGRLDDEVWKLAEWTGGFEDIAQTLFPTHTIPSGFETRAKVLWGEGFLYVAAELQDRFVSGSVTAHNEQVPYVDNDFEVFIDVSGTTHFYKEFEMDLLNGTYDVLWRATDPQSPGLGGVPCDPKLHLPGGSWCCNSTDRSVGFTGNWTMAPALAAAAHVDTSGGESFGPDFPFTPWTVPAPRWTAEVRFPISGVPGVHGGLTDSEASVARGSLYDFTVFDPSRAPPSWGPRYWWINFARSEHPLTRSLGKASAVQCADVKARLPTLLGDDPWSCYWSWVWQQMGATKYLHYPEMWGILEFAGTGLVPSRDLAWSSHHRSEEVAAVNCLNIEFPGRHVALQLFWAQYAYWQQHHTYTTSILTLLEKAYCSYKPPQNVSNYCRPDDVRRAMQYADIFALRIDVDTSSRSCVQYPTASTQGNATGGPCFSVQVNVTVPGHHTYRVNVNADRFVTVEHPALSDVLPCLNEAQVVPEVSE
ncbi:hypothetical protein AB1Y20_019567 [Prymnesium parvum]|uniref:Carbohydrate-binding domain-containing protein n=1 Tax=Prymnesium parvum TaxID=97485 RepID=A0AB34JUQ2_PRYPA